MQDLFKRNRYFGDMGTLTFCLTTFRYRCRRGFVNSLFFVLNTTALTKKKPKSLENLLVAIGK